MPADDPFEISHQHEDLCFAVVAAALRGLPDPVAAFQPGKINYAIPKTLEVAVREAVRSVALLSVAEYATKIRSIVAEQEKSRILASLKSA